MESEGPAEKYRAVRSSRQCCESCEVKVLVPPIACSGVASIGFAKLRSVELVGDELSVPGQQRIRFRDSRQFFQGLRLSRWAISANVAFSASDNNDLPLIWALRIRFSAARYSFLSSSSWSTVPVM